MEQELCRDEGSLQPSTARRTPAWGHPQQALEKAGHEKDFHNFLTMKIPQQTELLLVCRGKSVSLMGAVVAADKF